MRPSPLKSGLLPQKGAFGDGQNADGGARKGLGELEGGFNL